MLKSNNYYVITPKESLILGAGVTAKTRYDHSNMSLLSIPQAAECLGVSRATLYRLLDRKEIRSFHIGKKHYVTQVAISDYIRTREKAENYGW